MRNLNNFPDDLFELSGKRLIAITLGFIVFGGTLGAIITQKLIRRDILKNEIYQQEHEKNPELLKTPVTATSESVANDWFYANSSHSGTGSTNSFDLMGVTSDEYKKVWEYYAKKIDYASMVRGTSILPKFDQSASVSHGDDKGNRSVQNHWDQSVHYCLFSWEDNTHFVRVTLLPLKTGTLVSTFAQRKTK